MTDHDLAAARHLDHYLGLVEQALASPSPREPAMNAPCTRPADASRQRINLTDPKEIAECDHHVELAAKEASDRQAEYVADLMVGIVSLPVEDIETMIAAHQWAFERSGSPSHSICRAIVNATSRTIDAAKRTADSVQADAGAKTAALRTVSLLSQMRARWQQRIAPFGGAS